MNELTSLPSATIHRHLGMTGDDDTSHLEDYLDADFIIVDEFSMVDTWLMINSSPTSLLTIRRKIHRGVATIGTVCQPWQIRLDHSAYPFGSSDSPWKNLPAKRKITIVPQLIQEFNEAMPPHRPLISSKADHSLLCLEFCSVPFSCHIHATIEILGAATRKWHSCPFIKFQTICRGPQQGLMPSATDLIICKKKTSSV